jgi:hypothetical protein
MDVLVVVVVVVVDFVVVVVVVVVDLTISPSLIVEVRQERR